MTADLLIGLAIFLSIPVVFILSIMAIRFPSRMRWPWYNLLYHYHSTMYSPYDPMSRFLEGEFTYFRRLTDKEKQRFIARLKTFLSHKTFLSPDEHPVTERMKLLIGASVIQITLGLGEYVLPCFREFIIYPDSYPFDYGDKVRSFQGHTDTMAGQVHFSWKHFEDGYLNPDDARNLGLHEMAHAVHYHLMHYDQDLHFHLCYRDWEKVATDEFFRLRNGQGFMRSYAATSMDEFLAVSIEYFFEQPQRFQEQNPELYRYTCRLLAQNPLG